MSQGQGQDSGGLVSAGGCELVCGLRNTEQSTLYVPRLQPPAGFLALALALEPCLWMANNAR